MLGILVAQTLAPLRRAVTTTAARHTLATQGLPAQHIMAALIILYVQNTVLVVHAVVTPVPITIIVLATVVVHILSAKIIDVINIPVQLFLLITVETMNVMLSQTVEHTHVVAMHHVILMHVLVHIVVLIRAVFSLVVIITLMKIVLLSIVVLDITVHLGHIVIVPMTKAAILI